MEEVEGMKEIFIPMETQPWHRGRMAPQFTHYEEEIKVVVNSVNVRRFLRSMVGILGQSLESTGSSLGRRLWKRCTELSHWKSPSRVESFSRSFCADPPLRMLT